MKNEPLNGWYKDTFDALSEDPPIDVWQGISENVQGTPDAFQETPVVPLNDPKKNWTKWLKIAAVVAVLVGGGITAITLTNSTPEANASFNKLSYTDLLDQYAGQGFIESKNLEHINIFYLPDGTLVFLNKESRLSYPEEFTGTERLVVLEGEAFFDVARDEDHPFIIYSGNTKTEVLGTSFNLKAYDNQEEVELTVVSGEVKFSLMGHIEKATSVLLTKRERGVFNKSNITISESSTKDSSFGEWFHDVAEVSQTTLYREEASEPTKFVEMVSDWTQNAENETVVDGQISNSSALLTFDKVTLKATYTSESGERLASKFFVVEETVVPGQTIDYEQVMRDWIEGTRNIEVTIEKIEVKE